MARLSAVKPRLTVVSSSKVVRNVTVAGGFDRAEARRAYDRERARTLGRKLYQTTRWKALRLVILKRDHWTCQMPGCGLTSGAKGAMVVDHKVPHRGDEALFWDEGNLQACCKPCHDSVKQREERLL